MLYDCNDEQEHQDRKDRIHDKSQHNTNAVSLSLCSYRRLRDGVPERSLLVADIISNFMTNPWRRGSRWQEIPLQSDRRAAKLPLVWPHLRHQMDSLTTQIAAGISGRKDTP